MAGKLLYVSALCSEEKFAYISSIKNKNAKAGGMAGQKFNFLMVDGFNKNGWDVTTVSAIPVSHKMVKKLFWVKSEELNDGIKYIYCGFINLPLIRQICLFINAYREVYKWCKKNKDGVVACYTMNLSICNAARKAAKRAHTPIVGVITDLPGWTADAYKSKPSPLKQWIDNFSLKGMQSYDLYVNLTPQMNALFNPENKPNMVMEGFVPAEDGIVLGEKKEKEVKTIMYAGLIEPRYGSDLMVEGFLKTTNPNYRFILFGTGAYVEKIDEYAKKDSRLCYMGLRNNKEIVAEEQNADLMITIKPSKERNVEYSSPSKNMEYMASGTPVLTSRLPVIPEEYYPYVYFCDDETPEGIAKSIDEVLAKPASERQEMGRKAREFMRSNKNNVAQTKRIIDFINSHTR